MREMHLRPLLHILETRKLAVVSAYIEKPSQQTRDVQAPLSDVQNASADDDSIDSIPTNEANVNGNNLSNESGVATEPSAEPSATQARKRSHKKTPQER